MALGQKTGGRQKGSTNKKTIHAEAMAAEIIDDPRYRKTLKERAIAGTLSPGVEALLMHYRFGKPQETSRDDQVFMQDLLTVVLKHVESQAARQEIRAVLEAHELGATRLSAVA